MNKKVMAEATDNKRLEEQNSIALEQEEQKEETEVTSENDSKSESKEQENPSLAEDKISDTEDDADVAEVVEPQLQKNETLENASSSVTSPTETLSAENKVAEEPSAQKLDSDEDKNKVEEAPSPVIEPPKTTEEEALVKSEDSQISEDESGDDNEEEELHDDNVDAQVDYSHYSKKQLVEATEALLKESDIKGTDRKLQEIKTYFDEIENEAYSKALEKYLAEGGEKDGFEYKSDSLSVRFQGGFKKLKERKSQHFAALEAEKESNMHARQALLEELRNLVDSEETNQSISELKKIQQKWKSIGQAPRKYAKSLWASYNALVYRFYDNISIYYELKELDRKKNLEAKIHLCEKAESLGEQENIKEAIQELDALHDEFKHIGPVPKDDQEPLWERFKTASDVIHDRRREYTDQLKEDLHKNLETKLALTEKIQVFADFDSESIKDWNEKTKEIRMLQREWEAIGGMPREHAKEVNKNFWSGFKKFFGNKSLFFKKLDSMREENLKKKEELIARAEALKENTDWQRTADTLKQLQQEWKGIGPVPEKQRETVYKKFKSACDKFFNNRRTAFKEEEKDYEKNLKAKEEICEKIEQLATENSNDVEALAALNDAYQAIGFVPKKAIKSIQKKYEQAMDKFLSNADELDKAEKQDVRFNLQFSKLKNSPNAERKLGNKEIFIRKQISKLEDDLSVWKNNLDFFADSKQADKLKAEFGKKIEKADAEVNKLKQQLRVLREM